MRLIKETDFQSLVSSVLTVALPSPFKRGQRLFKKPGLRGFAVVADEIAKLADQTGQSLGEIDSIINKNITDIETGNLTMNQTVSAVDEIIKSLKEIGQMTVQLIKT